MSENRRIAKNTVMLYIRMAAIMLVTLYTSRVVLQALGVQDYGIYNIVGSVVISLSFVQSALNSATQRYISYEIGRNGNISRVFSMSLNIQIIFLILILLILETIGLWFLNIVLSIPDDRLFAANVAYQFSILTFCTNIIRVPYNAILISYERMNVYAWLSIAEALLRLLMVYILLIWECDKLTEYSVLIFIVTLSVNSLYIIYCKKLYKESCKYVLNKDYLLFKQMIGFSGWNLVGGMSGMASHEGPNYFMNIYLGVGVNAAMGIAKQVGNAVYTFTENFQTAFRPQIVKYYASNNKDELYRLVFNASKISYFLLFVVGIPILLNVDEIIQAWLTEVPFYTSEFIVFMLLGFMVNAISSPLWMLAHATGNIKKYQLWISGISFSIIPASWIILMLEYEPYYILVFQILVNLLIYAYRLFYAKKMTGFPINKYIFSVLLPCILLSIVILLIIFAIELFCKNIFWIYSFSFSLFISVFIFLSFGISKEYKRLILRSIKNIYVKR